jgi:hypothetical protein
MKRIAGILIIGALTLSLTSAAPVPENIVVQAQVQAKLKTADDLAQDEELRTRVFKIDRETFLNTLTGEPWSVADYTQPILQVDSAEASKARHERSRVAIRAFLIGVGLELNPPRQIFLNDRRGEFMIRATAQELQAVERALTRMNVLWQNND